MDEVKDEKDIEKWGYIDPDDGKFYEVPPDGMKAMWGSPVTPPTDPRPETERVDALAEAIENHSHVGAPSEVVIGCGRGHVERCSAAILAALTAEGWTVVPTKALRVLLDDDLPDVKPDDMSAVEWDRRVAEYNAAWTALGGPDATD